jgi:hypothetical protein
MPLKLMESFDPATRKGKMSIKDHRDSEIKIQDYRSQTTLK